MSMRDFLARLFNTPFSPLAPVRHSASIELESHNPRPPEHAA